MTTPTKPREGGIQYWGTDWTAQCEAKCRKTGLQCPHTCDSQIPSLIAGRAVMDAGWFSIQGRPVNLCRGHCNSWHARAKRLLTLPLIDGGHLSPGNRFGYGSIIIASDRIDFSKEDSKIRVKIPAVWGWVSWRGNVPEGMLDRIPHYVKPDPFLKETAGEELYSSAMFPLEVLKRCLAPSWDDCPVGTIAYSADGKHTWEKLGFERWKFDGQEMYCIGPGDLAVLVRLPSGESRWRPPTERKNDVVPLSWPLCSACGGSRKWKDEDCKHCEGKGTEPGMTKEIFDENYHFIPEVIRSYKPDMKQVMEDNKSRIPTPASPALALIREYLWVGGTWNPELMEHDKVRDMIMLCRDELERAHADAPCSMKDWVPGEAFSYELHSVRGGHVFAWQKSPIPQRQVLSCVICKKPQHELFPTIKG